MVMVLVAVAMTLGLGYLYSSSVRLASTQNLQDLGRAKYLADSGLQHALYLMRNDPSAFDGADASVPIGPYFVDGTDDRYEFYATAMDPSQGLYKLVATGNSRGLAKTAELTVQFNNSYAELIAGANPAHYWRLGDTLGLTAFDAAGGNDGQYRNGVRQGQEGAILHDGNGAADFDGWDDHIDLGRQVNIHGRQMTILAWFRANDFRRDDGRIVSKAYGTDAGQHLWMLSTTRTGGRYRLRFRLQALGGTRTLVASSGDLEPGRWYFAAATYDGLRMRLYLNGDLVGQCFKFGNIATSDWVDTWIGGNPSGDRDRAWHGQIDEVALLARTLSAEQIRELYQARVPAVELISWQE